MFYWSNAGVAQQQSAGTVFYQTVAATVGASGALVRMIGKIESASAVGDGILSKMVSMPILTGSINSTGALTDAVTFAELLTDNITASGALGKLIQKTLLGSVSAVTALIKLTSKFIDASLTMSGILVEAFIATITFAGSIVMTGVTAAVTVIVTITARLLSLLGVGS